MPACKSMYRIAGMAAVATACSLTTPCALAANECEPLLEDENLKGFYDRCVLILDLETFSRAWAKKEGWEEARNYSNTAIHTIDYLIKKIDSAPTQATLIQAMAEKRADLEKLGSDSEAKLAGKKAESDQRGKTLVNLRFPSPSPNVFVNGTQVSTSVYVPKGPVVLGVGQPGGSYDEGKISGDGQKLDVQVAPIESSPKADPAANGAPSTALDFSVGPIFGGRRPFWAPHVSEKINGVIGLRGEVALPDLVMRDSVRLRPVVQYSFEHGLVTRPWTIHNAGVGLKLTLANVFDVGLGGGISHMTDPAYKTSVSDVEGIFAYGVNGPELSMGVSHTIFNSPSMSGPKLGIGAGVAGGVSYWIISPDRINYDIALAPYIHTSVVLRLRFGRGLPPEAPSDSNMVHFKGGPVLIGWEQGDRTERPEHFVLLASFDLDVKEVTVAGYRACVDAGKCEQPETTPGCNWDVRGRRNHPINCVSREQASNYCGFVGKRLPTESEWEYAARGTKRRQYPWGDKTPTSQPCWYGSDRSLKSTCEVGSHPDDRTPDGVLDLAGNVSEWTGRYCDYQKGSCEGGGWVSRGGSFGHQTPAALRSSARYVPAEVALETVGFRCAR